MTDVIVNTLNITPGEWSVSSPARGEAMDTSGQADTSEAPSLWLECPQHFDASGLFGDGLDSFFATPKVEEPVGGCNLGSALGAALPDVAMAEGAAALAPTTKKPKSSPGSPGRGRRKVKAHRPWTAKKSDRQRTGEDSAAMFLAHGLADLEVIFEKVFKREHRHVYSRAREIFKKAAEVQTHQKNGSATFRSRRYDPNTTRKRFGKRRAYVVTAYMVAMKLVGVVGIPGTTIRKDEDVLAALSVATSGNQSVALRSVKDCSKILGYDPKRMFSS